METSTGVSIRRILEIKEERLNIRLKEIRASHNHRGEQGSSLEEVFREFLKEYLPPENRVGAGEVIDTKGAISTQLDVVITNGYHPYLNNFKEHSPFIIEGVASAGEVKTNLTSENVKTLVESCKAYKQLTPIIPKGAMIFGNKSDIQRFVHHRPYFIFAFQSQLKIRSIQHNLIEYYVKNDIPVELQIDGVFCLDRGSIINFGDGKGSLRYFSANGENVSGIAVTREGSKGVLLDFMTWLSVSIQRYWLPYSPLVHYLAKAYST